jgi:hypothetical protein
LNRGGGEATGRRPDAGGDPAGAFDWTPALRQLTAIRALTVRVPWEWAIRCGGKPVENRGKPMMRDGGLLWLHAGKRDRWDDDGQDSPLVRAAWLRRVPLGGLRQGTYPEPCGAITALMVIKGCHFASECMHRLDAQNARLPAGCSPWAARGQYHIEIAAVHPLGVPVPARGMPGMWPVPGETLTLLRAEITRTAADTGPKAG